MFGQIDIGKIKSIRNQRFQIRGVDRYFQIMILIMFQNKIFITHHSQSLQAQAIIYSQQVLFLLILFISYLFYPFEDMNSTASKVDHVYQQNQRLGYRINYLNDENNFYRITINNFKKLNLNINKHLLTANKRTANAKNTQNVVDPRTIGDSYTAITNKIHLKNLQMKVGNMKRKVDKYEKVNGGSISSLTKQAQEIQAQINLLSRDFEFYTIQNELLDNVYLDDYVISKLIAEENSRRPTHKTWSHKSLPNESRQKGFRLRSACRDKVQQLEEQNLKCTNKMEEVLKEQKQLRQKKLVLSQKVKQLREEREKLASQVYDSGFNLRIAQAHEMDKLVTFTKKQAELLEEIAKQDLLLDQQYKTNQEYKQKIMDRNDLEVKDIKSLQEKIKKRTEEVRDIKIKCQNLDNGKSKTFIKPR